MAQLIARVFNVIFALAIMFIPYFLTGSPGGLALSILVGWIPAIFAFLYIAEGIEEYLD